MSINETPRAKTEEEEIEEGRKAFVRVLPWIVAAAAAIAWLSPYLARLLPA